MGAQNFNSAPKFRQVDIFQSKILYFWKNIFGQFFFQTGYNLCGGRGVSCPRPLLLRQCNNYTHEIVVGGGAVDDSYSVVPGSGPLCPGVAVCVGAVTMAHVVLPWTVVDVAVVVIVAAVTCTLVLLPAA